MEIFKALMLVFVSLSVLNTVLAFFLWKSTKYRPCLYLFLYWVAMVIDFFAHGKVAHLEPFFRVLTINPLQFFLHYLIVQVLASMLQIPFSLKKIWFIPIFTSAISILFYYFKFSPEFFPLPFIITHAAMYFFVAYQAIRYHRTNLTPSLWALCILYVLFGLHLFDFAYFYIRFDLFLIGFSVALIFLMAFSIVVPAAIIERISMEKTLLEAEVKFRERLVQTSRMSALGEMAGGIAHELNNPLTGLLLSLESVIDFTEQPEHQSEVKPILNNCISLVDRVSHIVRSLLIFSNEDRPGKLQTISLTDLIDNTLILCLEKLKKHNVEFNLSMPSEEIQLRILPAQISQVLLNLIINAFEAVSNKTEKWIHLDVQKLATQIEFSVTDSGPGPNKDFEEKIFQPFFTTKSVGQGPGLGLSIAKGIIEAHGGKIYLDKQSSNTRFIVSLPLNN